VGGGSAGRAIDLMLVLLRQDTGPRCFLRIRQFRLVMRPSRRNALVRFRVLIGASISGFSCHAP